MKKLSVLLVLLLVLTSLESAFAEHATYEAARAAASKNAVAGEYAAARKDLEEAVALAVTPADKFYALKLIGESYRLEGNQQRARAAWSRIIGMKDADEETRMRTRMAIGSSYLNDNKPEGARAEFLKVTQNEQFNQMSELEKGSIFFMISRTYFDEKKFEQARSELGKIPTVLSNKPALTPPPFAFQLSFRPMSPRRQAFQLSVQSPAALLLILPLTYGETYWSRGTSIRPELNTRK